MIRVCFSGARNCPAELEGSVMSEVWDILRYLPPCEFGVGDASGVDALFRYHLDEYTEFTANWEKYGKSAGPRRNREMAAWASELPDSVLIAFPDDKSRGTWDCIRAFNDVGAMVYVLPTLRSAVG